MARKKKGKKLYTYRARNRRIFGPYHPVRTALSAVVTVLLVAVLGIVGYNIVGPVVTRMRAEAEHPTEVPNPFFTDTVTETAVSDPAGTLPVTTSETTALSTLTVLTSSETVTTVTVTSARPVQTRFAAEVQVGCFAPADALSDLGALDNAAEKAAAEGFTLMVLPLKVQGGMLRYASEIEQARTAGATNQEMLTLREIRNALSRAGLNCAAQISTLEDHIYPSFFNDGSYMFLDGQTRWLDAKETEGGKPWLSPFAAGAGNYLAAVAKEIQNADFGPVLCTDMTFPHFYDTDAGYLGQQVLDPAQRAAAIAGTMNRIGTEADRACGIFDLADAASGRAEGFEQLTMQSVCMKIDLRKFNDPFFAGGERYDPANLAFQDKITLLLGAAQHLSGLMRLYPCFVRQGMTEEELRTAVEVCGQAGYTTVFLSDEPQQSLMP